MAIDKHDILQYITGKQFEFIEEETDKEFILKHCPFCHNDTYHFYIAKKKGLYNCKKCDASGNFYKLQKSLGDVPGITDLRSVINETHTELDEKQVDILHANLLKDPVALKFFHDRGMTDESIEKFKLGYDVTGWVTIPHYYQSKLVNIKYRQIISEKKFKRIPNCKSVLFNIDNLDYKTNYVIIVEGELDAVMGSQCGFINILGTTVGADTFPGEWLSELNTFKYIYICYDSDEAGQRGARKAADKLGIDRCKNVILPDKDLNDFLLTHTRDDFKTYLKTAKTFDLEQVTTLSTCIDRLDEHRQHKDSLLGLSSGYSDMDRILRGFQKDDLIIVSGASSVGKTTLNLNFVNSILKGGHSILCYLLEGRLMYSVERLISIELGKPLNKATNKEIEDIKTKFREYQLYFYTGPQSLLGTTQILEITTLCQKTYDIELVIIDNLHKILDRSRDNQSAIVGKAVSDIKNLAVDLKIPIILISHLKKMENKKKMPDMDDLKDSSAVYQDSDIILMLWADREDEQLKNNVIIKVTKNRGGEDLVELNFIFNRETGQYIPMTISNEKKDNETT